MSNLKESNMSKERWDTLLDDKRFREKSRTNGNDARNPFENDYGRLISSPPIRRLQDKTQVFPLEKSDYIRTRLTHSLEVSYMASSIGQSFEKFLINKKRLNKKKLGYIPSLLRVAGLVHDLGNPSFGHFGEEAFKTFFKKHFKKIEAKTTLSERERADFINFDGNVQTLRILKRLHFLGDKDSFNLTYSSLASIIKYPSNSLDGNKGSKSEDIGKKKFGYFTSDQVTFDKINNHLKLNNKRHPLVYLLEAADDIAYSAADIEDGVKLGILSFETIRQVFEENLKENKEFVLRELDRIYEKCKEFKNDRFPITVQKFRIFTQAQMISAIVDTFDDKYKDIMTGELDSELIDVSKCKDIRKSYKELQKFVFNNRNILLKELAGSEAISGLLEIFVNASNSPNFKEKGNNKESRLYQLISSSYRYIYENYTPSKNEEYKKIQLIVDYISGMTDSFAISLYQELKGINL